MKNHIKNKRMGISYILDNGAYTAKFGTSISKKPEVMPNCIMKVKSERRRPFVGDQINECRDASGLFYILPFQKGYLVNWDVQKTVWDYMFSKEVSFGRLSEQPLCITEPLFNFQSNQEAMDEIFFEEYECCGILRITPPELSAYNFSKSHNDCKTLLIIDSGYSFTHIIPFIDGVKYMSAVKRIDVGGKILTNHLKEVISYRQLHVMDETYVINQVKEDACYLSLNFRADMYQTSFKDKRNKIVREYVLPDYSTIKRGYLQKINSEDKNRVNGEANFHSNTKASNEKANLNASDSVSKNLSYNAEGLLTPPDSNSDKSVEQQTIILNNERITIPEILFHPSDIGITQMGIPEAVVDCINDCPEDSKYKLLGNIVVMGGNAKFANFGKRLFTEIRQRFNEHITVNVHIPPNPITFSWFGGKILTSNDEFYSYITSKEEYEEYGHNYAREHTQMFKI